MNYIRENNSQFCMPGHKQGRGFLSTEAGRKFYNNLLKFDLTEVDGLDNLHHADGIIKAAEEKLKSLYGSEKSYFLVNGSTSGNLAMIFSSFEEGDKVIVERNCHRSIFNAIIMRKLRPVYIKNDFNNEINAPLSINEEYFFNLIKENGDAKGIIITYPSYYGVCCDLEAVAKEAKKRGMKVLVDAAHGAHFGISKKLPQSPVKLGCDMVVMSSHKTLPSLTQTAYLHICNRNVDIEKVDFYVSAFLSTSPSYLLMSSMDYGRFYLEEKGKEEYEKLIKICDKYIDKINKIDGIHILNEKDLKLKNKEQVFIDKTRFVINIKKGYSGFKLYDYLKDNLLQPEMCDSQNVILIFSPFNTENEFNRLYEVLKNIKLEEMKAEYFDLIETSIPEMKFKPWEALEKKGTMVKLHESEGSICRNAVVPYPPGIPILMPGEIVNKKSIEEIEYYLNNGATVLGVEDSLINIVAK